jgi:hypothetical protein
MDDVAEFTTTIKSKEQFYKRVTLVRPKQLENPSTGPPLLAVTKNYLTVVTWCLTTAINWFCDKYLDRNPFFTTKPQTSFTMG